jgi:hypothetical protein
MQLHMQAQKNMAPFGLAILKPGQKALEAAQTATGLNKGTIALNAH